MKNHVYVREILEDIVLLLEFSWQHDIITIKVKNDVPGRHCMHTMVIHGSTDIFISQQQFELAAYSLIVLQQYFLSTIRRTIVGYNYLTLEINSLGKYTVQAFDYVIFLLVARHHHTR
ncbi:hypothetical protein D3C84_665340 [compost metagenome]